MSVKIFSRTGIFIGCFLSLIFCSGDRLIKHLRMTDCWDAYQLAIPSTQHVACEKQSGQVSLIECFNYTLRQRASRLGRKSLSFSKSDWFHEEDIKYFIARYNLQQQKLFEHYFLFTK